MTNEEAIALARAAALRELAEAMNGLPSWIDPTCDEPPHRIPPHGPSAYAMAMNEWVDKIEEILGHPIVQVKR